MIPRNERRKVPRGKCCGGRGDGNRLVHLGIEQTSLEREKPHAEDCPLLRRNKRRRDLTAVAALALLPALAPQSCQSEVDGGNRITLTGLDDGTIGMTGSSRPIRPSRR